MMFNKHVTKNGKNYSLMVYITLFRKRQSSRSKEVVCVFAFSFKL
jgi:hypothetical protein